MTIKTLTVMIRATVCMYVCIVYDSKIGQNR